MKPTKLKEVLDQHKLWLEDENRGCRADLSGANLSGADLAGVDLRGTKFTYELHSVSDLSGVNFDPDQLPWLRLNPRFLESVQSSSPVV
jgi:uncharacterized protein YjbI with pentapeptide repeats